MNGLPRTPARRQMPLLQALSIPSLRLIVSRLLAGDFMDTPDGRLLNPGHGEQGASWHGVQHADFPCMCLLADAILLLCNCRSYRGRLVSDGLCNTVQAAGTSGRDGHLLARLRPAVRAQFTCCALMPAALERGRAAGAGDEHGGMVPRCRLGHRGGPHSQLRACEHMQHCTLMCPKADGPRAPSLNDAPLAWWHLLLPGL